MSCTVCGRPECNGSCATPPSSEAVRDAALRAAERRHAQSAGDTLPDYDDGEDEDLSVDDEDLSVDDDAPAREAG